MCKWAMEATFQGKNQRDLASGIGVMAMVLYYAMFHTAASLQVSFSQDAKASNLLSDKEYIMLHADLTPITKTKAFVLTTFSKTRL